MDIEIVGNFESLQESRRAPFSVAIEGLYAVFEPYKLRPIIEGCDCCITSADNELIHSKVLRQLSGEDLSRYGYKALTTWGDANDLRHFLPRLLQLVATGETWVDEVIICGKLRYGKSNLWPAPERKALADFFEAWWAISLAEYPGKMDAFGVLWPIACANDDIRPFLAMWQRDVSPPACAHLAIFICEVVPQLAKHRNLGKGFWKEWVEQTKGVVKWLQSQALAAHVENQFILFEQNEPYLAGALSETSQALEAAKNISLL